MKGKIVAGIGLLIVIIVGVIVATVPSVREEAITMIVRSNCPADSCHDIGTVIENSCFFTGETKECEFVVEVEGNKIIDISETDFAYTVSGDDILCVIETGGFGGAIDDPRLLCFDKDRYLKSKWIKTEENIGLSKIVTFTIVGGLTSDEHFSAVCLGELEGISAVA